MKRITNISILTTSRTIAAIVFLLMCLFILLFVIITSVTNSGSLLPSINIEGLLFVMVPLLYSAAAFVISMAFCFIYNKTVQWTGGIAITIQDDQYH